MKSPLLNSAEACQLEIERMLKNSQTKVIMPVVTLALLRAYCSTGKRRFSDSEIRVEYEAAVKSMKEFLGHDVHVGARYYDAYGSRMSRYQVLQVVGHLQYELAESYCAFADTLTDWIPGRIRQHIDDRLGVVPQLRDTVQRMNFAASKESFLTLVREQIDKTPANFEIFSFAVLKVHLEKFACRIYRDTRTAAHDSGVDLSTNFGVVYQVKKIRIHTEAEAEKLCSEIRANFDTQRVQDGNVIVVIDDISKQVKQYLVDMKIQSLSKQDLLALALNFEDPEDRQKVLRVVFDEFRREYSSVLH
ncbi:MAG: HaeII family restriction endonuclease [Verrucomicrobiaceae bacterium]